MPHQDKIFRPQFTELSNAAFRLENFSLTEKLLICWLREYPNDLWMRYRLAIVLYKSGKTNDAIRLSELIVRYDPEFAEVWALLSILYPEGSEDRKIAKSRCQRLKSRASSGAEFGKNDSFFGKLLRRKADEPSRMIEETDDFDILSALRIAKDSGQQEDPASYERLLSIYMRRWPQVIQFKLLFGQFLNRSGAIDKGANLIHSTVASDLLGMAAERMWGNAHDFKRMYYAEDDLSVDISAIAVPENVAAAAKLETLTCVRIDEQSEPDVNPVANDGERGDPIETEKPAAVLDLDSENDEPAAEPAADTCRSQTDAVLIERPFPIETKRAAFSSPFSALFKKTEPERYSDLKEYVYKLDVTNSDERFPIYVVLSTIGGLTAKYGKNNKEFIGREMQSVADAVDNREGWNSMVFYPDEFSTNARAYMDPILIKQELVKLDRILSEKGSMIGAVLIVGGPEVVPFFTLKNPAMDDDPSIPSDAPYATYDEKRIFDQQWQLGRVPGDNSSDPGLLLSQLRQIQNYHIEAAEREIENRRRNRKAAKRSFCGFSKAIKESKSFGLSAQVWERPSVAVFRNVSATVNLLTSPGVTAANFPTSQLEAVQYAYFNLHGIKGNPNWYGQKDPRDQSTMTLLPLTLQMNNLDRLRKAPEVIFAENCYGAEIDRRNESNAISLHLIGKGTRVFIGSTVIAYGAVTLPLTAADLLAHLFWNHLRAGISTGEAFRRAKKNFASETERTSGGLDGEIQKTILSFVFYGDPLFAVDPQASITDRMQRAKTAKNYELVRERLDSKVAIDHVMAKQIYEKIKETCNLESFETDYSSCTIQKQFRSGKSSASNGGSALETNYVLIYTKEIRQNDLTARSLTRVTVSPNGEILKVSFSR